MSLCPTVRIAKGSWSLGWMAICSFPLTLSAHTSGLPFCSAYLYLGF